MKIKFAEHDLWLDPSGILFWPDKSLLVVSDLHLEKGSHFARRGFFLPPYDSHETLERLHKICAVLRPEQLLILGDCFHDEKGFSRLPARSRALFDALLPLSPLWIYGNHDGEFVPPGFSAHKSYNLQGITFRHEAAASEPFEISGHFHPKVEIAHKKAFITRDCFIEDGNKLILPAFGSYTGGLSVTHPSISSHMNLPPRIYALGEQRIFFLPAIPAASNK